VPKPPLWPTLSKPLSQTLSDFGHFDKVSDKGCDNDPESGVLGQALSKAEAPGAGIGERRFCHCCRCPTGPMPPLVWRARSLRASFDPPESQTPSIPKLAVN